MANWHIRVVTNILLLQGEIVCTMCSSWNNLFWMAFTPSEIISVPAFQNIKESNKTHWLCEKQTKDTLPPVLQKDLGLYLLPSTLSCPLVVHQGCGWALPQAQKQLGPGKVIRGDQALCTHSLFGIPANPGVSSLAAFTASWAQVNEAGVVFC